MWESRPVLLISAPRFLCEIGLLQEFYLNITTFVFCFPLSRALIVANAAALRFFAPASIISIQVKLLLCGFELFFNILLKFLVICSSVIYFYSDKVITNFMIFIVNVTKFYKIKQASYKIRRPVFAIYFLSLLWFYTICNHLKFGLISRIKLQKFNRFFCA